MLSHEARNRPTASELLKSHPLLKELVGSNTSPMISGCLPAQRVVFKIIKVLSDDDDVVSSLSPRVGSSTKGTFSNQLEMIRNQLGLAENQVVNHSDYAMLLLSLISLCMLLPSRWKRSRCRSRRTCLLQSVDR